MSVRDQVAFGHGPLGSEMHGEDGYVSHQVDAVPGMTYFEWLIGQAIGAESAASRIPIHTQAEQAIQLADAVCTQLDDHYRKAAQHES